MHKLAITIQWLEDVNRGEMIESKSYTKTSLKLYTDQLELDAICEAVNSYYEAMGESPRITNSMGEIKPFK